MSQNTLGLYIHIPYCVHKCGYCDFNSHPIKHGEMQAYIDALIIELNHYAEKYSSTEIVNTIFLGGGTPTTLSTSQLGKILEECEKKFNLETNVEITIETNPATISAEKLRSIRGIGYNRISVGVQSFDKTELKLLDRIHGVEEIHTTIERARDAGFSNLSLDLMFAIPNQTLEKWESNLHKALDKDPEHFSTYNLTIEQGTAFWELQSNGKLTMPDNNHQFALYQRTIEILTNNGYNHYEISNFSKLGKECRHNITYWRNTNCLGLGAGASSYISGLRFKNANLPTHYIKNIQENHISIESSESLEPRRAMGETIMLGLRLLQGINIHQFEERFQTSFYKIFGNTITSLLKKELIIMEQGQLRLSEKGLFLADSVILEFI